MAMAAEDGVRVSGRRAGKTQLQGQWIAQVLADEAADMPAPPLAPRDELRKAMRRIDISWTSGGHDTGYEQVLCDCGQDLMRDRDHLHYSSDSMVNLLDVVTAALEHRAHCGLEQHAPPH